MLTGADLMTSPNESGNAQTSWNTVEELCDRYLGARPSDATLTLLKGVEEQRPEVRDFVERAFRLMAITQFDAGDISPVLARFFTVFAPGLLPGAWGGMVPPITLPGRHKRIDAYLRATPWAKFSAGTTMLDIGCGFPPQTAIDAAESFPDWQITGVDPAFEKYLVFDGRGNYALIGEDEKLRYFQPTKPEEYLRLFADRAATIQNFTEIFEKLLPTLPPDDGKLAKVEENGMGLVRHPQETYERANLKFIKGGFGSGYVPQADVARSFNVLIYFDSSFRREAEAWIAKILRPGGLFICGRDDSATLNAHYTVYRSENGRLAEKEFAFGLEMVRHCAWYTLHEGEHETWKLATVLRVLRSDPDFLRPYDARLDGVLAEQGVAIRDGHGFMDDPPKPLDPSRAVAAYEAVARTMEEEFADRAIATLERAGLRAWRNPAGHVAVTER